MDFISGCSMLVPRETFQRVGLLDERFFIYCEDADLCLRMRDAGLPLRYCAEAEVWHKGGATAVHHSSFHDYHNAKSLLHFVRKHRPRMLPIAAAYLAVIFFTRKIARGQWARVRSVWRGFTDFRAEVRRPGHPAARTYGTRQARAT
jgi:hypothetical protein